MEGCEVGWGWSWGCGGGGICVEVEGLDGVICEEKVLLVMSDI